MNTLNFVRRGLILCPKVFDYRIKNLMIEQSQDIESEKTSEVPKLGIAENIQKAKREKINSRYLLTNHPLADIR